VHANVWFHGLDARSRRVRDQRRHPPSSVVLRNGGDNGLALGRRAGEAHDVLEPRLRNIHSRLHASNIAIRGILLIMTWNPFSVADSLPTAARRLKVAGHSSG
jgi:hypothetical protein